MRLKNVLRKPHLVIMGTTFLILVVVVQFFSLSPVFAQSQSIQKADRLAYLAQIQQTGEQQCAQPPQNTDFGTLTDEQLTLYGLPTHAELDKNASLKEGLAHIKQRACGTSPVANPPLHHFGGQQPGIISPNDSNAPSATPALVSYNSNWAGNEAYGRRGTYRAASLAFTIPRLSGPAGNASFWAGVGGHSTYAGSSPILVQAGVDAHLSSGGKQSNVSWWEVYPKNYEQNLPLVHLSSGDKVNIFVSSNLNSDGYDYFFMQNETAGTYNTHYVYTKSWFTDGATGECIGERPSINGRLAVLPNFGIVRFTSCLVNAKAIGSLNHVYDIMEGKYGDMVTAGAFARNKMDFSLYWHYSQ